MIKLYIALLLMIMGALWFIAPAHFWPIATAYVVIETVLFLTKTLLR